MKKVTIALSLIAMMLSAAMNSLLHAEELLTRDEFHLTDEKTNEYLGRTGGLEVRGVLLSSPCTLITNELQLPLLGKTQEGTERYPLKVMLTGCGDGDDVTSAFTPAGRSSVMVVYTALLSGVEGGVLFPDQRMLGTGRAVLHGGSSQMTWYLTEGQQMALQRSATGQVRTPFNNLTSGSLLRLRMDYE